MKNPSFFITRNCYIPILSLVLLIVMCGVSFSGDLSSEVKNYRHKLIFETFQNNNWDLFVCNADGSNKVNLTNTPNINELYPHASPDGKKVSFVVDQGKGRSKIRNVYYMNIDGTNRKLVDTNARQACWKSDSSVIAYLKGEFKKFNYLDYATKGIYFYNLKTGKHTQHPNKKLGHLYNLCWAPDGKWFVSTVHAGMGYKHAILAIEANGQRVVNLNIPGCRPDISPDGKHVAWGASDWTLRIGDLDFSGPTPKVINKRDVVTSPKPMKIYHIDWSPDGKYVAYSRGPEKEYLGIVPEIVGIKAKGWDIYIADSSTKNRSLRITTDGNCHKEPDWIFVGKNQ